MSKSTDYDRDANSHREQLESEISSLSSNHKKLISGIDGKAFFSHVKEINGLFKSLKPIRKSDREELWARFQEIIENAKSTIESERTRRWEDSKNYLDLIMHDVNHARPASIVGITSFDELKFHSESLNKAGSLLSKYKNEMIAEHKSEIFEEITRIRKDLDAYWDYYRKEKEQKHHDFIHRTRENIQKNEERLAKATDALHRQHEHRSNLHDQIADARSDDFRDRASGWLAEAEDKISDIEESVKRLEQWIEEDRAKLR